MVDEISRRSYVKGHFNGRDITVTKKWCGETVSFILMTITLNTYLCLRFPR